MRGILLVNLISQLARKVHLPLHPRQIVLAALQFSPLTAPNLSYNHAGGPIEVSVEELLARRRRLKKRNASPVIEKATTTIPTAIPAFAPPLKLLLSEVDMGVGVAGVVEIADCVAEMLAIAVLEADEDIWVDLVGEEDAVKVDEKAPSMTKKILEN
ncbi:hypothetical protein ACHAP3_003104 [Botrytis cinerea]